MVKRRHKVALVFGTRPEAIKSAPLAAHLSNHPSFALATVLTAQHREMVDQVVKLFRIPITRDLDVMTPDQTLDGLTAALLIKLATAISELKPDCVIVQGDTTTTLVAAQTAFYHRIPIAHVEAGLRTSTIRYPFPEEMNRRVTSVLADFQFAPTERARQNLLREGVSDDRIWVTGNTGIDALRMMAERDDLAASNELGAALSTCDGPVILVTAHRRENLPAMTEIARAIVAVLDAHPQAHVVFPVHLNPRVRSAVLPRLRDTPRCHLLEPLPYDQFVLLMKRSYLILTDSGGIQEEAPSLGKPVLVMRRETERPEAVEAGTVRLVGDSPETIVSAVTDLLTNTEHYQAMTLRTNPFGDGHASERIARVLDEQLTLRRSKGD